MSKLGEKSLNRDKNTREKNRVQIRDKILEQKTCQI